MSKGFFQHTGGGQSMTRLLSFMAVVTGIVLSCAGIVAAFFELSAAGTLITIGGGILVSGEALKKFGKE